MKSIVLTGMMGSGKTTIGKLLSNKLNLEFFDIDTLIEEQEGIKISEIFSKHGEKHFRTIEKEIIKKIFSPTNSVISLGGGAFENTETRDFLLKNSNVIYLKTSPEQIFDRIKNNKSRPLLCDNMNIETINNIINQRKHNYETASYIINTDNKKTNEIIEEITGVLE